MATIISKTQPALTRTERLSSAKLLWAAPLTGLVAASLNALVYSFYSAVGFNIILPLPNPADPSQLTTPLPLVFVVSLSFLAALGAGGLLWALGKYTQRPLTLFTYVSIVALILSFGASLPLDMPTAFKLGLDVMHIIAALTIINGLTRFARQD